MVISTTKLTKTYHLDGIDVNALQSADIQVKEGEFVAIMGPSGSGKSTLLNLLGCLDTATSGEYYLDGEKVEKTKNLADIRNRKVGFIFQSFNLLPRSSALGNVELPMMYAGESGRQRTQRAVELLKSVGLGERLSHKPNQLSGGEKQRVAIARALANNPAIILADEPTGNLDSKSGEMIMSILHRLDKEEGKTIIMVTHDIDLGRQADRIIKLLDGRVVS